MSGDVYVDDDKKKYIFEDVTFLFQFESNTCCTGSVEKKTVEYRTGTFGFEILKKLVDVVVQVVTVGQLEPRNNKITIYQ